MHAKIKNNIYRELMWIIDSVLKKRNFKVITEFDKNEMTFSISNVNTKTDEVIYTKKFGYRKETEKDALISRAYEEYIKDMMDYGIVLNYESFITTTK